MKQLLDGCLLRVEEDGGEVVVVEHLSCVSVLRTEVAACLVLEGLVSLYIYIYVMYIHVYLHVYFDNNTNSLHTKMYMF